MTLIKIYFVNTIKATGQEVAKKIAEKVSFVFDAACSPKKTGTID